MFRWMKSLICMTLLAILMLQMVMLDNSHAVVDDTPQIAPDNLRLNDEVEKPIGYNEAEGYYIDIKWDVIFPGEATGKYINIYIQEVDQTSKQRVLAARDVNGGESSYRLKNLKSGTIYYIDLTAYHTHTDIAGTSYSSGESVPSVRMKVMTDIKTAAFSQGTNEIKIEWDDVWDTGRRIDYKLYVSESSSFNNTPPIYVSPSQIGQNGPVKVNAASEKLEYIHRVRDPGRVYYVKVVPDIVEGTLKRNPVDEIVAASSFILVKTTKLSQNDGGVVWRLDWSSAVTGINDNNINISYQIYRGDIGSNSMPQYVAAVDGTSFFITLPSGGDSSYYIIRAYITRDGQDVYPGIKIQSDRVIVKEADIPSQPPAPELVNRFNKSDGSTIISYDDMLKPDSATILWRIPRKGDGTVDEDVEYDIWLIKDPNFIDNPPVTDRIEASLKITAENRIINGTDAVGCKYVLQGLNPNSTYYFRVVARKRYIDYVDGKLQEITMESLPVYKIIITPSQGAIEQPLIPSRPPLKVKVLPDGRQAVTTDSVIIQLKNRWYEKYENSGWNYVMTDKLNLSDVPEYDPIQNPPDDLNYREVNYDTDVTLNVGCIKYEGSISYSDLAGTPANMITDFPVTANDASENPVLNSPELENPAVYKKHNVDVTLSGLEPNTTYIIWVTAARSAAGLVSGPSDPIVVTTGAVVEQQPETPVVPAFRYAEPNDTYVDLVWSYNVRQNYYIKYAEEDNPDAAGEPVMVTAAQLFQRSSYRVEGLKQDTMYYFWIQSENINADGSSIKSGWSDSLPVKTLPFLPPDAPVGFGIVNSKDAAGKNSIAYEWLAEDGLQYILEIADNMDFTGSTEYNPAEKASTYTVEGLESNCRYYARLYAYDPEKDMRSLPTYSVIIKTERSNDDYDSDQDTENPVTGEFVIIDDEVVNREWKASITGVNAVRFIEQIQNDYILDYRLDLSNPPSKADKLVIDIAGEVFTAMNSLKENFIIETGMYSAVIRPGMFSDEFINRTNNRYEDFNFRIVLSINTRNRESSNKFIFEAPAYSVEAYILQEGNAIPITSYDRPLGIDMQSDAGGWSTGDNINAVLYNQAIREWEMVSSTKTHSISNNADRLSFEMPAPGKMSVATAKGLYYVDIIGTVYESSLKNVASLHELKSAGGRFFNPDAEATVGEAVKLMFDMLDYGYKSDYMMAAAKAGIILPADITSAGLKCTREKAIAMAVRVYEIKSGQKAVASSDITGLFTDVKDISPVLAQAVGFAIENGMVWIRTPGRLAPLETVTRGEILILLEKMLALAGELE